MTTTKEDVTIEFDNGLALTGELAFHPERAGLLELDTLDGEMPERFSINLEAYGHTTPEGHTWIKDWSEHAGVTASLVETGAVQIIDTVQVGPFSSTAHLVKILF